jgi:two-component system, OmpR family, sensor histidine kinase MprB
MTFRRRLLLACAAAVAAAVALAAVLAYVVVHDTLRGQIDDSLRTAVRVMPVDDPSVSGQARFESRTAPAPGAQGDVIMLQALEGPVLFTQVYRGGAVPEHPVPGGPGPLVSAADLRALASGMREPFFTERDYNGVPLRVYASGSGDRAIVVARPLTEMQSILGKLRIGLGFVILAGVGLALLLGRLATRAAVKPVADLTETAEHVARTRDLTSRIAAGGDDELSRLAASFNTMLEALEDSQRAQRRLVADASHELRTPLTSLRTNLEVLSADGGELDERDRAKLRADVVGQLGELIALVSDLVDLAREEEPEREREEVRLDELVAAAVERAARHAPGTRFACELDPTLVVGVPARLDRAVTNLLDNAAKWSPPGAEIDVALRNGELSVRDRGPGIAPEDLPFVFDRFYRAPGARGRPGSGLGLAIVRQVAEAHGGGVEAGPAPDGGALLVLRLPVAAVPAVSSTS